jgi:hypothetical protein
MWKCLLCSTLFEPFIKNLMSSNAFDRLITGRHLQGSGSRPLKAMPGRPRCDLVVKWGRKFDVD